jgi:hypothetical protein
MLASAPHGVSAAENASTGKHIVSSRALSVSASPVLRTLAGVALLVLTGAAFLAVVQLDGQAAAGVDLLKSYLLMLSLGGLLMLDIAWFSAVARANIKG